MRRFPALTFVVFSLLAASVRGDEIVLTDGRRYRGEVRKRGDTVQVTGGLRVVTVLARDVLRHEEEPELDRAPFLRLTNPIATVDPQGARVPLEARPASGGRFTPEGELTRQLQHPDVGTFPVKYRITEIHPRYFLLEGIDRPHAVRLATGDLKEMLFRLRSRDLASDDDEGWLEMARFSRLAGWLERAESCLGRVGEDAALADALLLERAAWGRARAEEGLARARSAVSRHELAGACDLLGAWEAQLGASEQKWAGELAAGAARVSKVEASLSELAAVAGEDRAKALFLAVGNGLTAAQAACLEPFLGPGAEEPLAHARRLRAVQRYGPYLDPAQWDSLEVTDLEAAEVLLGELLEARGDDARLEELFRERLAPLRARLPYPVWTALVRGGAGRTPGELPAPTGRLRVAPPGGEPVEYLLRVPASYREGREAPLLVVLHGQGQPPEAMLGGWTRFAEQQGLLLTSVEYQVHAQEGYHHSWQEHRTVLEAIRDIDRRYAVDHSRVFVSGASMGGHAAWDLALSFPHRFAGGIPVIGSHFAFEDHYRRNGAHTAIYCLDGEFDFAWPERNRRHTRAMHRWGADVTYAEYRTRGHESFPEEYPWLAQWLRGRARDPYPSELELRAARPSDSRRYWLRLDQVSFKWSEAALTGKVSERGVAKVRGRVERARNRIRVDAERVGSVTVFLADELLDLDRPVEVRFGRARFRGRVERSVEFMLRDFLRHGDRQLLFATSVELTLK